MNAITDTTAEMVLGITPRSTKQNRGSRSSEAVRLYVAGWPLAVICKRAHISPSTLARLLLTIPTRPKVARVPRIYGQAPARSPLAITLPDVQIEAIPSLTLDMLIVWERLLRQQAAAASCGTD